MRIMIDPGHGGSKLGAIGKSNNILEKDINLAISRVLQSVLIMEGYEVSMTRNNDIDISLVDRVFHANSINSDLFVSIHCNGSVHKLAEGIEVYTSKGNTESDNVAKFLQTYMLREFSHHKDFSGIGPSEENFYVLKRTKMPAILIECEFITNTIQGEFLKTHYVQLGKCIGLGISEYYKMIYKSV